MSRSILDFVVLYRRLVTRGLVYDSLVCAAIRRLYERGLMGESVKYHGKGSGGAPTFQGTHNKARFLALLILVNIDLHYRHLYPEGIPVDEWVRVSGVKKATLARHLGEWCRRGFVTRVQRPTGYWIGQSYCVGSGSAGCFYYSIGERGRRWVSEYQDLVPREWYEHLWRTP